VTRHSSTNGSFFLSNRLRASSEPQRLVGDNGSDTAKSFEWNDESQVLFGMIGRNANGGDMPQLKTFAAMMSVVSFVLLAPAHAQDEPTRSSISDQKLDQAAAAIARVDSVNKSYQQKLAQTPPDQHDRVIEEADDALEKAVTDQGLSIDEYDTILETAQNDPAVQERLLQHMRAPKE
jgi:hypothetical protein